jgi:hypothetical protein
VFEAPAALRESVLRYVAHEDVAAYEAEGWHETPALVGTHHGKLRIDLSPREQRLNGDRRTNDQWSIALNRRALTARTGKEKCASQIT